MWSSHITTTLNSLEKIVRSQLDTFKLKIIINLPVFLPIKLPIMQVA